MPNLPTAGGATPKTQERLLDMMKRAEKGDASALPAVRELLQHPGAVELFGGDLARQAEESLIGAAAGKNLGFKEALTRKLELIREELNGPNATPLERLLVERVAACWLQVQDADVRYAQLKDATYAQGEYYQRRMDRAHRRYLSAIRMLALVRRLALPVVQVNIAKKQVNVAGPYPAEAPAGLARS